MFGLNAGQTLAITVGMLSVVAGGSAQLTPVIGAVATAAVVALCSLAAAMLSVPLTLLFGQANQLRAVTAMPGVKGIVVNAQSNSTLASMAVGDADPKIAAAPEAVAAVQQTANKTGG